MIFIWLFARVGGRQDFHGENRVKEKSSSDVAAKFERKVFSNAGTEAEKVVSALGLSDHLNIFFVVLLGFNGGEVVVSSILLCV